MYSKSINVSMKEVGQQESMQEICHRESTQSGLKESVVIDMNSPTNLMQYQY